MLKIKDSSSEKYIEMNDEKISIYNCGPTVYNDVHIGNVRPLITFDVLYRYLKKQNKPVIYVHNITDVDDKIINRSIELHKPELELADHYFKEYLKIIDNLNALRMDHLPKVSDNIEGIIDFVKKLTETKHAYVVDGDVYFDIKSIDNYGSVSHQKIDMLLEGVRKDVDEKKKFALDFALWKKTDKGISWVSPWNDHGRPGWHTECVYLINKYIGKQTVIQGGGVDLKFPHHENENAQNMALNNIGLSKCWMHVGHVNIDGKKMSKSLNNFILAKDMLERYDANTIRWFFFQTKYASPLNFSYENLEKSKNEIIKIFKAINNALISLFSNKIESKYDVNAKLPESFIAAADNDLDLPNMVTVIWEYVKNLPNLIRNKKFDELSDSINAIRNMLEVLGVKYLDPLKDFEIRNLISQWVKAMENKDYKVADAIRKQLNEKNIL